MSGRLGLPVFLVAMLLATGCSISGKPTDTGERLRAEGIDALTGPAWIGTLKYLD